MTDIGELLAVVEQNYQSIMQEGAAIRSLIESNSDELEGFERKKEAPLSEQLGLLLNEMKNRLNRSERQTERQKLLEEAAYLRGEELKTKQETIDWLDKFILELEQQLRGVQRELIGYRQQDVTIANAVSRLEARLHQVGESLPTIVKCQKEHVDESAFGTFRRMAAQLSITEQGNQSPWRLAELIEAAIQRQQLQMVELEGKLSVRNVQCETLEEQLKAYTDQLEKHQKKLQAFTDLNNDLEEQISSKNDELTGYSEKIGVLTEELKVAIDALNKLKQEQAAAAPKQQIVEQKLALEEKKVAVAERQVVPQPVIVVPVELEPLRKENQQLIEELHTTILERQQLRTTITDLTNKEQKLLKDFQQMMERKELEVASLKCELEKREMDLASQARNQDESHAKQNEVHAQQLQEHAQQYLGRLHASTEQFELRLQQKEQQLANLQTLYDQEKQKADDLLVKLSVVQLQHENCRDLEKQLTRRNEEYGLLQQLHHTLVESNRKDLQSAGAIEAQLRGELQTEKEHCKRVNEAFRADVLQKFTEKQRTLTSRMEENNSKLQAMAKFVANIFPKRFQKVAQYDYPTLEKYLVNANYDIGKLKTIFERQDTGPESWYQRDIARSARKQHQHASKYLEQGK